jgi:hypothetical protein
MGGKRFSAVEQSRTEKANVRFGAQADRWGEALIARGDLAI